LKQPIALFGKVAVLAVLLTTLAFAGGFQLNEHGARAMGMGGAFVARASDLSAIYFNPAGLAYQKGAHFSAGVTLIMPTASFYGPDQLNTNQETKMVSQVFNPINVYASYEIADGLVAGFGVNNPYGLGTEWPSDWSGRFISTKVDLETFFFTPTLAYRFGDNFSVGVGMNYVTGKVTIKRVLSDPFDPHANVSIEATGTAIGFNAGLLYKFSDKFSIGASYRSEAKVEATGTASFDPVRSVYPAGDMSSSLTLPATGFVGIAYTPFKNLTLEANFQYVGWSSYKELALTFKKDNSVSVSPKNYENTFIIRAGAEYTWNDWQFRGGYLYDRSPAPTKYVEPLLPDANRNELCLGLGYKLSSGVTVDLAYMFIKFDQRKAVGTEINFDGTYSSAANLFAVNFGYSF
jgi:long-chain fatty acid transport protein